MSFLGSVCDFVSNAASAVVNTAEDIVGGAAKVGIGVVEAGAQTVGDIVKNPLELLNPFSVLSGAANHLVTDIGSQFASGNAAQFAATAADASASAHGGGIGGLTTAMDKLGGQINDLMDQISKLDPKDPNYATKLASLNLQLQQAQAQFSQLENLASDLLKKSDDDVKTVERNLV